MHPIAKRIKAFGFDISVETPKGSHRHWKDPHSGESGSTKMLYDYGYIRRTEGTDGDHVDVYVGPNAESDRVFIIDQLKKPDFKQFDEQKVMLGFDDADAARAAYLKHYNDPRFFGSMKEMSVEDFREKVLNRKNHGKKVGAERVQPPIIGGKPHRGEWSLAGSARFNILRPGSDIDYMVPVEAVSEHLHEFKQYKGAPGVYWKEHPEVDGRKASVVAVPAPAYRKITDSYQHAVDSHTPEQLRRLREELGKHDFYKKVGVVYTSDAIKQTAPPFKPSPTVAKEVKKSVESFLVSKGLPKDTPYALLAGASMYFHGLRPELKDADIVVQGLGNQKFNEVHGKYEVDGGGNIDDLGHGLTDYTLRTRHQDHGVQFASLPATLAFKKALNRDKDRADIVAIEQHINGTNMPFKSKAQARAALGGYIPGFSKEKAEEWAHKTKSMKKLPEHVSDKKSKKHAEQSVLSDHNDPPGYMMVQNLNQLADQAAQLSDAVSVEDNAEPWVESKIDRAAQAIDAVHDYMQYKSQDKQAAFTPEEFPQILKNLVAASKNKFQGRLAPEFIEGHVTRGANTLQQRLLEAQARLAEPAVAQQAARDATDFRGLFESAGLAEPAQLRSYGNAPRDIRPPVTAETVFSSGSKTGSFARKLAQHHALVRLGLEKAAAGSDLSRIFGTFGGTARPMSAPSPETAAAIEHLIGQLRAPVPTVAPQVSPGIAEILARPLPRGL